MKKVYFLIMIFSILLVKPENIDATSMDIEYLDILIDQFKINESIELNSDNGFEIILKEDKKDYEYIEGNSIFLNYKDDNLMEILDEEANIIKTIPIDESILIKGEFYGKDIIQVGKNKYRGYISFSLKGDNILIINHIKVNEYLYGVLPREVGSSFSYEALKAQAVASKNYAFSNINKHENDGFHLCNTTHCQVYGGYDWEDGTINKAIDETINIFITYRGELISAPYHSNSGGYTENSEDVWGGTVPYLRAVEDEFSLNTPYSTWDIEMTPLEIGKKLSQNGINIGEILDLEILEKTSGGRISKCRIKGSKGEEIITGAKLRSILGNTYFKSTSFEIQKNGLASKNYVFAVSGDSDSSLRIDLNNSYILKGKESQISNRSSIKRVVSRNQSRDIIGPTPQASSFKFIGKGYGHGVGMSQWGANEMAKKGHDYKEILKHYYNGIDFLYVNEN